MVSNTLKKDLNTFNDTVITYLLRKRASELNIKATKCKTNFSKREHQSQHNKRINISYLHYFKNKRMINQFWSH